MDNTSGGYDPKSIQYNVWLGVSISFLVGYLSGLLGFGGGIVHVPAMVHVLNFPVHYATATSHFILAITALTGTAVHVVTGALLGRDSPHDVPGNWRRHRRANWGGAVGTSAGALIVRALAVALAFVGVRVLLLAL